MDYHFKALRLGFFAQGILDRLDATTRELLLEEFHEADKRLAAATPDLMPTPPQPLLTGAQVRHLVLACNLNSNKLAHLLGLSAYELKCALNPSHKREFSEEELETCTQYFQQLRAKMDQALHTAE